MKPRSSQFSSVLLALGFLPVGLNLQQPSASPTVRSLPDRLEPGPVTFGTNSSPYPAPTKTDVVFVVNEGGGLDTGCTFRSGSPLVFSVPVDRHVGDVTRLRANGLIAETALLQMPAFDVDFDAVIPGYEPERDQVFFNDHLVTEQFLTGSNNVWKLNTFRIPVEWIRFPDDPGAGGHVEPLDNVIRIDIDTANGGQDVWCTSIDWASLTIEAARPVVMVHGIFSSGAGAWGDLWVPQLTALGLPNDNNLNMGPLDGIASNALKISTLVDADRIRWGVQKVVLVCHSKGGLDSRHCVENRDSVARVVQIGTPNAGSPLADVLQLGAVVIAGPELTPLINVIAGPGGIQLTTPYMALYNRFHGANPDVRYTALAGRFNPDCSFFSSAECAWLKTLLFITGDGDTIVPAASVHALSYTTNAFHDSAGLDDQSATHTELNSSLDVFRTLLPDIGIVNSDPSSAALLAPSPLNVSAVHSAIIHDGETQSFDLTIDHPGRTSLVLFYPSGDLDMTVRSPSGVTFDEDNAPNSPAVVFGEGPISGGIIEAYQFEFTELGVWHISVFGHSVVEPSGTVGYAASAVLELPSLSFVGTFTPENISAGDDLILTATLVDAVQPVLGADVQGTVRLPTDILEAVHLNDDGVSPDTVANDGVYAGELPNVVLPGTYRAAFEAVGSTAGRAFVRQAFGIATVAASSSHIDGVVADFGVDTNGNGLFDRLVLRVGVTSTLERSYRIIGELTDSSGNSLQALSLAVLPAGPQLVELSFDGPTLFAHGTDGPYSVSRLALVEEEADEIRPLGELLNSYQTAPYGFAQFEHAPILFTGLGTDSGLDTNGNGLFDLLEVMTEVRIEVPDSYQWSGRLVDPTGVEVGFASGSGFLIQGLNLIGFAFDGERIGQSRLDGPYTVRDVLISGRSQALVAAAVYTTSTYSSSQFEGGNRPPDCSVVEGHDVVLWPPDHRMSTLDLVATTGITDPDGDAITIVIDSITQDEPVDAIGTGDGATRPDGTGLGTSIARIRRERDGRGNGRVYNIRLTARDNRGGECQATLVVKVPHDTEDGRVAVDDGQLYDSTAE